MAAKQADVFTDRFEEDLKRVKNLETVAGGLRFANPLADITTFSEEFTKVINTFAKENADIQAILNDTSKPLAERLKELDAILIPMIQDTDKLKEALSKLPPEFDLSVEGAKKLVDELSKNVENLQFLEEFKAPDGELKKMLNPLRQILDLSVSIRNGFEESFKGIIKGTMTVGEAFRNMLNRIADHFFDSAARMAAIQIQKGFLGLFSNMFTGPINDVQNTVMAAANGGPVGMRQPYLVGEKGPELFVPNQSGNIIPNHDLAGVGSGSTSVVVNVDASGTSVEGDQPSAEELGRLIGAVVQSELIKEKRPGGLLG